MSKLLTKVSLPSDFSCSSVTLQLGPDDTLAQALAKLLQKHGKTALKDDYVLTHEGILNFSLVAKSAEAPPPSEIVHLGDQITLFAMDEFAGGEKRCVGAVKTEKGLFGCIPSRGVIHDPSIYRASTFTLVAPPESNPVLRRISNITRSPSESKIEAESDAVCYGMPLVLVDRAGLVWNNKLNPACVDMRQRGLHGEMFVKFERVSVGGGTEVRYGDKFKIVVYQSNRRRTWFNKAIARTPLKLLPHAGQALSCDGGDEVFFEVREGQQEGEFWTLEGLKQEENVLSPFLSPQPPSLSSQSIPSLELDIPSPNRSLSISCPSLALSPLPSSALSSTPFSSSSSSYPSSSAIFSPSDTTKTTGRGLRYGDTVMLAGFDSMSSSRDKRLVGAVTTDAGVFACIPVISVVHDTAIFRASTFTITAPPERTRLFRKVSPGITAPAGEDEVCYGDVVVLVDRSGLVWNNSSNPACVDFRPRGTHGEMFVKFEPTPSAIDDIVRFSDRVKITVHLSNRHRNNFNRTLTTQPIKAAPDAGLALSCDGGTEVDFVLLPMVLISSLRVEVPRTSQPTKYKVVDTRVKVAWGEQVDLSHLQPESRLVFELANHASVTIPITALSKQGRADFDAVGGVRDTTGKSLAVTVAWDATREHWTVSGRQMALFLAQCGFILSSVTSFMSAWWKMTPWGFTDLILVIVLLGVTHVASRGKVCFELYTRRTLKGSEWSITPQALTTATAPQVPQRFVRAENGDAVKAGLRYQTTLRWRRENGVDTLLQRPHPKFELIKRYSSAFLHGHDKLGHVIYVDRPGKLDWTALMNAGVTQEDLMHHFRYLMEYKFTVLAPDENAKAITILDMEGVNLSDTRGEKMDFVKKLMAEQSTYCPERTKSLFIINVPFWFGGIWKVMSAFLPQRSLDKISICAKGSYQAKLLEIIDAESLPTDYGGNCASPECKVAGCAKSSAMELALLKFVKQGNTPGSTESKKTV